MEAHLDVKVRIWNSVVLHAIVREAGKSGFDVTCTSPLQ
jgi:hypothetical protein